METLKLNITIEYDFKPGAYCDEIDPTHEQAKMLDKAFVEDEGIMAFMDWLMDEDVPYRLVVE